MMVRDNLIRDKHNVGEGTFYLAGSSSSASSVSAPGSCRRWRSTWT